MALPRLRPSRPRQTYTEEVSSRVGPLRGLAGLGGGFNQATGGVLGAVANNPLVQAIGGGPGSIGGIFTNYRNQQARTQQENDLADMFADSPELLQLARLNPELALQESLYRGRTADERGYEEGLRTQSRGWDVEDREDAQAYGTESSAEAFQRQIELANLQAQLSRESATAALTGKPLANGETWVNGVQREVIRLPNGDLADNVTGAPVDPASITFEAPTDAKTTLDSMSPEGRTRVMFSGPNAIEAAQTMTQQYGEGYSPNQDWGAAGLRDAPIPGGDALARIWGGSDYQQSEQAWKQFEAGMLPILSGAAVTDSEAKRVLNAMKPAVGDTPETIARKVAAINRMSAIAEQAIGGQPVTDLTSIVEIQPFLSQAQVGVTGGQQPSIDDLVSRYAP